MALRNESCVRACRDGLLYFIRWVGWPDPNGDPVLHDRIHDILHILDWMLGEDWNDRQTGTWVPFKPTFESREGLRDRIGDELYRQQQIRAGDMDLSNAAVRELLANELADKLVRRGDEE